jgi:nitrite reductase/ring-hydroxylating ferredoxin subunit
MVCKSDELPNNSIKVISVRDSKILVCRSNNQLFAFDNSCPHRGASLSKSEIKGTKIVCYMHDFEYDLNNGKLIHIPSKNGQIYLHI